MTPNGFSHSRAPVRYALEPPGIWSISSRMEMTLRRNQGFMPSKSRRGGGRYRDGRGAKAASIFPSSAYAHVALPATRFSLFRLSRRGQINKREPDWETTATTCPPAERFKIKLMNKAAAAAKPKKAPFAVRALKGGSLAEQAIGARTNRCEVRIHSIDLLLG